MRIVETPTETYDVIIVGAGFAGMTASRELSNRGWKTLILEGRDRIGGRTWTDKRFGRDLEMGGTWVHWSQPHVWAEIMRYGLEITSSPRAKVAYWFEGGELKKGPSLYTNLDEAFQMFIQDSREHIPLPYDPLQSPTIKDIDKLSIKERLDELDLDPVTYDLFKNFWEAVSNGSTETAGYSMALRWYSLAMHDWRLMLETLATYKLAKGTKALLESIARDSTADIRFSTTVARVEKGEGGYEVYTKDAGPFKTKAVIVTLPINVLHKIAFAPALSKQKQLAASEGQTSRGMKFWAKLRGKYEPFAAYAPAGSAISNCHYEYEANGDSIIVGFGPDAAMLDPNDLVAIQKEIRRWFPNADVLASTGHNWVADEFSEQTWFFEKSNHQTRYLAELQRPEEGVFLSGADYASGWAGMIDGAIESGLAVSQKVQQYLDF
ncbi:flavin monoamine oxidase family protein [Brevibacillus porteri]|uniref:flavin monoamine oxidase family protein n=1 Tax=Brevibacillus porteri TaxID=2126350 RepID=UPI003D1B703B